MRVQRFFERQSPGLAQPPPNAKRTGIQIAWHEGKVQTIKIRYRPFESTVQAPFIYLNPARLHGRDTRPELDLLTPVDFASGSGRRST